MKKEENKEKEKLVKKEYGKVGKEILDIINANKNKKENTRIY